MICLLSPYHFARLYMMGHILKYVNHKVGIQMVSHIKMICAYSL